MSHISDIKRAQCAQRTLAEEPWRACRIGKGFNFCLPDDENHRGGCGGDDPVWGQSAWRIGQHPGTREAFEGDGPAIELRLAHA